MYRHEKRFCLIFKGGGDEHAPIVVSRVALNTSANRASLHEGDHILSINHIDIQNHSHEEVNYYLKNKSFVFFILKFFRLLI